MRYYLAILPFSKDTLQGEYSNSHLVLMDKWFNLHVRLPFLFQVSRCEGMGAELFIEFNGNYKIVKLPWHKESFKQSVLVRGEWIDYDINPSGEEAVIAEMLKKEQDKVSYTFSISGRIITAVVSAHRFYDAVYWFPIKWKNMFNNSREFINIELFDGASANKQCLGLYGEWFGSIEKSWKHFKNNELQEILSEQNGFGRVESVPIGKN